MKKSNHIKHALKFRSPREGVGCGTKRPNTLREMEQEQWFFIYTKKENILQFVERISKLNGLMEYLNLKPPEFIWAIDSDKHVNRKRFESVRQVWIKTSFIYFENQEA